MVFVTVNVGVENCYASSKAQKGEARPKPHRPSFAAHGVSAFRNPQHARSPARPNGRQVHGSLASSSDAPHAGGEATSDWRLIRSDAPVIVDRSAHG